MEREMKADNSDSSWFVIYTTPRSEKKVNESLLKLGFETFCPTQKVIKQWSDRRKKVDVVLFTSYVFVKSTPAQFNDIYTVRGFVRFVNYLGKPAIVRDIEIENIKNFLSETSNSEIEFEVNSKAKIVTGPLKGHVGLIEKVGKNILKLRIESLGMSLTAHLNKDKIEPILP